MVIFLCLTTLLAMFKFPDTVKGTTAMVILLWFGWIVLVLGLGTLATLAWMYGPK